MRKDMRNNQKKTLMTFVREILIHLFIIANNIF